MEGNDLPVVDANTDALPNSIEGGAPTADAAPADNPGATPMDQQALEAANQMAETPPAPTSDSTTTASTESPAGPSMDAPPSMNDVAPAPVAQESTSTGGGDYTYEIQAGDTLMKVAYKVYGDIYQWKKILEDNRDRIANPSNLVAGTQLKVENQAQEEDYAGFEKYLIKNGDTLGTISDDVYGTNQKWKKLWKMNDRLVKDPNRIYAGFFLKYSMTDEERNEADHLKQMKHSAPPLADGQGEQRNPSSVGNPNHQSAQAAPAGGMQIQRQ